tara:strand:+ start:786 stop:1304 length:519 start_codon:yes stop_codon:yes gene_type:complete
MKIAIIGNICSGKTTLANTLSHRYNLQRIAFADSVKYYVKDIFKVVHKDRKLIQDFAEKMREIDEDIWVKKVQDKIQNKEDIVIDDLRFLNEYKMLKANKFFIVKLKISKETQIQRIKQLYVQDAEEHIERLNHISESYIDSLKEDLLITNEKELKDFIDYALAYTLKVKQG